MHRLVWEDWYGKPVPNGCEIHHLNGDKLDNRIQNLQCVTKKNHRKYHRNSYKPNARVVKYGSFKGKKRYAIWYEGKVIKQSIFKDKLEKIVEEINCTGDEENKDRLSFTFNRDK